jgi:hypothetical protein
MTDARAFLVERYWPGATTEDFRAATERLVASLGDLSASGVDVELLHSTYVPTDEAAQWVVRAVSAEVVRDACASAAVLYQRLLPAVDSAFDQRADPQ